jgi:hypothetical protein
MPIEFQPYLIIGLVFASVWFMLTMSYNHHKPKTYWLLMNGEWKFALHDNGSLTQMVDDTTVTKCRAPYASLSLYRWDYVNRRFYLEADASPVLRVVLSYNPYTNLWRHEDPMWFERRL